MNDKRDKMNRIISIDLLRGIKQYSPLFDKTFDKMTDEEMKAQRDLWLTEENLPKNVESLFEDYPCKPKE